MAFRRLGVHLLSLDKRTGKELWKVDRIKGIEDGPNADRWGSDYRRVKSRVDRTRPLEIRLAPGGGWAARISPES